MSAESANVVALDWRNGLRKVKDRFAGDELNLLSAFRACPDLRGLVRWIGFPPLPKSRPRRCAARIRPPPPP